MTAVESRPSGACSIPVARQILLIEDNPDGRETLRILLEIWGHHVRVAGDGREGVERALAQRPDVAIVDIGLPIIDGYEVARRLRSAFGRRIILIALTGYSRPDDRRQVFQAGFDFYLSKPADLGELSRMVNSPAWSAEPAAETESPDSEFID